MQVIGIDISNNNEVNASQVVADFVFHKATEGQTYVDKYYASRGTALMARGIPFGAYHYARVHEDAKAQVGHFLSVAKLRAPMLVPFVDIEGQGNSGATGVQWRKWLQDWFHEMYAVHERRCGVYVSPGFADAYDFGQMKWLGELAKHQASYLFVAHWGVAKPRIPKPWTTAQVWQFNSNGHAPGVKGSCDMDKWLATFDSLTVKE